MDAPSGSWSFLTWRLDAEMMSFHVSSLIEHLVEKNPHSSDLRLTALTFSLDLKSGLKLLVKQPFSVVYL